MPITQACTCRAFYNKSGTYEKLHRRGVHINESSCVMCGVRDESVNHLFLLCRVVSKIWYLCDT